MMLTRAQHVQRYKQSSAIHSIKAFARRRYRAHKQITELQKRLNDDEFLDDIGVSRAQVFEQIKQLKKAP